ncbi:MAG: hypothetical protein IJP90_16310 [Treponema sp.]|nr:hypothetical protein [Treponema sp.]
MNKLLRFYTVSYLIITFSAILIERIPFLFLIREGYILLLFVIVSTIQITKFRLNSISITVLFYIALNTFSLLISQNRGDGIGSYIMFVSGPIIFLFLSNVALSVQWYKKYRKCIDRLLFFFVFTSLILYPVQGVFAETMHIDTKMMYRWSSSGTRWMRLTGLSFHATSMGAVAIFAVIFSLLHRKKMKMLLSSISYYLTNSRTVLFGIIFAFYSTQRKKIRFLMLICSVPMICGIVVFYFSYTFDPSALIHFADVFIRGPNLLSKNLSLFGRGHGMMSPYTADSPYIHLESDLYISIMQVGILGFSTYILLLFFLVSRLKKDRNIYAKYCVYILFIINIGGIFFPLHTVRFLTNYMWIELGLYFSYRRNLKVCHK